MIRNRFGNDAKRRTKHLTDNVEFGTCQRKMDSKVNEKKKKK
jgi:hypothetical protein